MSDRFEQPERGVPNDPRRIFIPAPSGGTGAPANGRGGPTGAPPRPGPRPGGGDGRAPSGGPQRVHVPAPQPEVRRAPEPRREPFGPGPGGPRDPYGRPGDDDGFDPDGAPGRKGRRRPHLPGRRLRRVVLVLAIILVLGLVGSFLWIRSMFSGIERIDTEGQLAGGSAGGGTNYLIVGSDSREVVQGEEAGINDGDFPGGQRSDTMLVLHVGGDGTKIMSIPRDLYVPIADTGETQRINAAYNGGPPRLLRTVQDYLEIPIHRYLEVDFVSFGGLVDGLGGITIDFPHPATDANSGLNVTQSGPVELDGEQALAYVRSRYYVEHINGEQVQDPTGDLGRILRQQRFLSAVFAKLADTKNPLALASAFDKSSDGLRIDDGMGLFDAIRLGWRLRGGLEPAPFELPVDNDVTDGGAQVLILRQEEAQATLDEFR